MHVLGLCFDEALATRVLACYVGLCMRCSVFVCRDYLLRTIARYVGFGCHLFFVVIGMPFRDTRVQGGMVCVVLCLLCAMDSLWGCLRGICPSVCLDVPFVVGRAGLFLRMLRCFVGLSA